MRSINSLRRDPAPSRVSYRWQRLWLTPFFRLLMRSVGKRGYQVQAVGQPGLGGPRPSMAMAAPAGQPAIAAPPAPTKASEVEQRVTGLVAEQPGRVADVVQAWIRED